MRRCALASLFFLVVAALSFPARANGTAPFSRPTGAAAGVLVERASPLVVEREELIVDCTKDDPKPRPLHPRCTFVATYALRNPSPGEEELLGAFYTALFQPGVSPSAAYAGEPPVMARLDGVDVRAEATDQQLARMDALVREDPEVGDAERASWYRLQRDPFRIAVAGGQRAQLVFNGELRAVSFSSSEPLGPYHLPALLTRHPGPFVPRGWDWETSDDDFVYLISPLGHWAGAPEVHVTVRHRSANGFAHAAPTTPWTRQTAGDVTSESTVVRASARQNLRFHLSSGTSLLKNGGPVVGIGPRIGREELRVRLGYEVGLSTFLILGASAETNFDAYVTGALTLDLATASALGFIPSLGIGGGAAVQARTGEPTRAGARSQLTIAWPVLSIAFPVDVYPVAGSAGSHVEGAFLTQLSF